MWETETSWLLGITNWGTQPKQPNPPSPALYFSLSTPWKCTSSISHLGRILASTGTVTRLWCDTAKWTNRVIFYLEAKLELREADFLLGLTHCKIKLMKKVKTMVPGDVGMQRCSFLHFFVRENKNILNLSEIYYLCWQFNQVTESLSQLIGFGIQHGKT